MNILISTETYDKTSFVRIKLLLGDQFSNILKNEIPNNVKELIAKQISRVVDLSEYPVLNPLNVDINLPFIYLPVNVRDAKGKKIIDTQMSDVNGKFTIDLVYEEDGSMKKQRILKTPTSNITLLGDLW